MTDTPDATPPVPTPAPGTAPAGGAVPVPPAATAAPVAGPTNAPVENRSRGTALALIAIPAGIIVWNIVWAIGFISGWVALGVALAALALYRKGSGGRVSYNAAVRLSVLTVVTLVLAFIIGLVVDRITFGGPVVYDGLGLNIVLLVVFAALGVFVIVRTAVTQAKQDKAAGTVVPPPA